MPRYQLYRMDPRTGHIEAVETLLAGDDVEASYLAAQRRGAAPLELWRDGKKVVRVDAAPGILARFQAGDLPGDRGT